MLLAVIILAVSIGANTAIFSVVNSVLLRPLPYSRPDRLVQVWAAAPERGLDATPLSNQRFLTLAARDRAFDSIGAYTADTVNLTGSGEPARLNAVRITSGVLETLGPIPIFNILVVALFYRRYKKSYQRRLIARGSEYRLPGAYPVVGTALRATAAPSARATEVSSVD